MDLLRTAVLLCVVALVTAAEEGNDDKERRTRDVGALLGEKFSKGSLNRGYLPPQRYYPAGGFGSTCDCRNVYPFNGGYPGGFQGGNQGGYPAPFPGGNQGGYPTYGPPPQQFPQAPQIPIDAGFDDTVQVYPRQRFAPRPNSIVPGPSFSVSNSFVPPSNPAFIAKTSIGAPTGVSGPTGNFVNAVSNGPIPRPIIPTGPQARPAGGITAYSTGSAALIGGEGYNYDKPSIPF